MTGRSRLVLLVYLDLLFAQFAGIGLLNLVQSVNQGKTPHRLDRDFAVVTVYWSRGGRGAGPTPQAALVPDAGGEPAPAADPVDGPPDEGAPGGRTVYVFAPVNAGGWRFEPDGWAADSGRVDWVAVDTRVGTARLDPQDGGGLRIRAGGDR